MATQKAKAAAKAQRNAKRNAARKEARAAKKAAAKRTPEHKGAQPDTGSADKAGVGTKTHPGNKRIPEKAIIQREPANPDGTKITASPEVQGDKALMIIDNVNSRPVHVSLLEGKALTKDTDGRVLFIQGPVSNKTVPIANARSLFAVKKDGTVIYNDRGFDDVPAGADFDLVDIVALIEHNN
jgi:hypothetical protein